MLNKPKLFLTQRSQEKELMDMGSEFYTQSEYVDCLEKLFDVNLLLGFFHGTKRLLKRFSKTSTILDIGCGGGLFLLHLSKHFPHMRMRGVDISTDAIHLAQQKRVFWQQRHFAKYVSFQLQQQPDFAAIKQRFDILLATLVFHHVDEDELVTFLQGAYQNAKQAVIINDLHRHWIAEWFYACTSPFLFRNRLITHDGLISIRRGFTRRELTLLLQKANIQNYDIKWCFPFRWRVILWKVQ